MDFEFLFYFFQVIHFWIITTINQKLYLWSIFVDINTCCLRTFLISDMTVARLGITIWLSCRPAVTNRSSCSHWTRASCSWDLCRQFFITTRLESNLLQIVHSILQPSEKQKTFQLDPFKYYRFKKVISEKNFLHGMSATLMCVWILIQISFKKK